MGSHPVGGALGLVVHDAAIGVQGERETAAKPLHGLVEGREPNHDRDDAHRDTRPNRTKRWLCSSPPVDCCSMQNQGEYSRNSGEAPVCGRRGWWAHRGT